MKRVRKQLKCTPSVIGNLTGKGVIAAVLDSGVAMHPDFDNRIIAFQDFVAGKEQPYDDYGHGTHVCGILAGSGAASFGTYRGVAPGTKLVVAKILDKDGGGKTRQLIQSLQWIDELSNQVPIKVVNISISLDIEYQSDSGELKKQFEIAAKLIDRLWEKGILVTAAAGNNGPSKSSISQIGIRERVLCVGCHDENFRPRYGKLCESYSGRGSEFYRMPKPDIVAPGTEIVSCNSSFTRKNGTLREMYCVKSGTSMATPIISGLISLLYEKYPHVSNSEAKNRLLFTARDLGEDRNKQGYGMVNPQSFLA